MRISNPQQKIRNKAHTRVCQNDPATINEVIFLFIVVFFIILAAM